MIVPSTAAKAQPPITEGAVESKTWLQLKFAIAAAFLAGLALSPHLWLSERWFPFTPVLQGIPPIPPPFDRIAYGLMLAALAIVAFVARPARWIALFVALLGVMAVSDQMRWQPWTYQYLWMIGAIGIFAGARATSPDAADEKHRLAINTCRLVIVCTYFWSGIQKLNADFIDNIFPFLTHPLAAYLSEEWMARLVVFAYPAPLIEAGIGIALLFPKTRRYAVAAAIAMHVLILLSIGPLGRNYNSVVWPWNIAMIAFVLILFTRNSLATSAREILWPAIPSRNAWFPRFALLMVGVMPALSLFNLWDSYLSFALYSGSANAASIEMKTTFADRLPKPVLYHVFVGRTEGMTEMNLQEWSLDELNVPLNPERRIYRGLAGYLCPYEKVPGEAKFHIYEQHNRFAPVQHVQFGCAALANK